MRKRTSKKHLILAAAVLLAAAGVLVACGSSEGSAQTSETSTEITTADTKNNFAETSDSKKKAHTVRAGQLKFTVPSYYNYDGKSTENGAGQLTYSYSPGQNKSVKIQIAVSPNNSLTTEKLQKSIMELSDTFIKQAKTDQGVSYSLTSAEEAKYKGMPGYSCDFDTDTQNGPAHGDMDIFLDESSHTCYIFLFYEIGDVGDRFSDDYVNMMKNAKVIESTATTAAPQTADQETEAQTAEQETEPETQSAENPEETAASQEADVNPDLKAALDHYEQLMNDYCDFMEKYKNADSSDLASMLDDYTKTLKEYSEAMDELNAIDTNSLSTADMEYYLDVTNRVSKRLLEVS